MLCDVPQAVAYSLPTPSRQPRRRDAADLIAPNSSASRRESGRAVARQCRAATRRRFADRECRSSLPAGAHGDLAARAAARRGRSRAGMTRPCGSGRCSYGQDGDRAQTACPAPARGLRESGAAIPGRYAYGSAAPFHPARQCERRDHPRPTAGNADRLSCAPTAPAV